MPTNLDEAIKVLVTTYLPLDLMCRGVEVNAKDLANALKKADPESVEFTALNFLANFKAAGVEVPAPIVADKIEEVIPTEE